MPTYSILHRTTYSYSSPVIQSHHLLHLTPRSVTHQDVERHSIVIEPTPTSQQKRNDYFGNPSVHITLDEDHREFSVTARSGIKVDAVAAPELAATTRWEDIAERKVTAAQGLDRSVLDFACRSRYTAPTATVLEFARDSFQQGMPVLVAADALMKRIYTEFRFDNATTDVSTPVDQVIAQKSGVCQDFAHLQISALRAFGLPARYVSGYIRTHPPDGAEKLAGSDASHAWVSVWAPETGWVDFDPTNNLVNSPDHITVAYGRDFDDVSPISGVLLGGGAHSVAVAVDVTPL
ncbi:MAG: transglutaminase family protein [Pseudomonadota bacterium]